MKHNMKILQKLTPIAILAAATMLVFSFSINYPILNGFDDNTYITANVSRFPLTFENLRYWMLHPCQGCYQPLVMFSYMLDYTLWGLNAFGYHLQSVMWHIITVVAVYACSKKIGLDARIAFLLSLIFALHPQRVESVVWLSERKDVMCAAFYFWALFFYLNSEGKKKFKILTMLLFACALLSKAMAITLPAILILHEFNKQRHFNPLPYLRKFWPYLLMSLVILCTTKGMHSIAGGQTNTARQIIIIFYNYLWYIGSTFFPYSLAPIYPRLTITPVLIWSIITVYIVIIILSIALFKRDREQCIFTIFPLAACYIITITPIVGIYHIGYIDYADRFNYIPSPFLLLALAFPLGAWLKRKRENNKSDHKQTTLWISQLKRLVPIFIICYACILGIRSVLYARAWNSIYSLFESATRMRIPNHVALGALGDVALDIGNNKEVLIIANRLEKLDENWMVKKILDDNRNKANYLRGVVFANSRRPDIALIFFEKIKPLKYSIPEHIHINYERMLLTMASCYHDVGNDIGSVRCMKELVKWMNNNPRTEYYKGCLALYQKKYADASVHFSKTLEIFPNNKQAKLLLRTSQTLDKTHNPQ